MKLGSPWMETSLWLVMNVGSLCVGLAMSMKGEKGPKFVLNAGPDTSVLKVLEFVLSRFREITSVILHIFMYFFQRV